MWSNGQGIEIVNAILFSISDSFLIFDLDFIEISCICTKANALYANNL